MAAAGAAIDCLSVTNETGNNSSWARKWKRARQAIFLGEMSIRTLLRFCVLVCFVPPASLSCLPPLSGTEAWKANGGTFTTSEAS